MSVTHQSWENGPGSAVGCKLAVHRRHHATGVPTCRRPIPFYSLSSFNSIIMHSPPSEICPTKDPVVLESQANAVVVRKPLVQQLKAVSHELCSQSQENGKIEGCQIKARSHVHFRVASEESNKNGKITVGSTTFNESPSSSPSSSSIGQSSNDSSCLSEKTSPEPGEEKEVQSSLTSPLDHMTTLEDSLPIKRGLSRFYKGKSQSFTSLADVSSVSDLAKPENSHARKRKSLHEYGNRFGYPPISGITKKSLPGRGRGNPLPPSAGCDLVDALQVSTALSGMRDQQRQSICSRSYSLGDLQGREC